jgi:hypothetical protein
MAKLRLAKVSVEDLKKEIARRQRKLPTLIAARDTLDCLIAELEGLGGVKPKTVARRRKAGRRKAARRVAKRAFVKPAKAGSLRSALVEVLGAKGKLTAPEAAEAVLDAGYKSKSKAFQKVVRMMLLKDKRFRRVSRGVYALKG